MFGCAALPELPKPRSSAAGVDSCAVAVMVAFWGPSAIPSATAKTLNVAELCPAGITTETGTVASVVSLLLRLTVRASEVSPLTRVTVPTAVEVGPLPSRIE